MDFLSLGIAPLVSIKDRQIIEHRSHVGMIGAELFLVNFKRVQIIWLSCLLAAGLAENERDIVQHCPQIRIRQLLQLRPSSDRFLIKTDRFLGLAQVIAQKSKAARGVEKRALIGRFYFFKNGMGFK